MVSDLIHRVHPNIPEDQLAVISAALPISQACRKEHGLPPFAPRYSKVSPTRDRGRKRERTHLRRERSPIKAPTKRVPELTNPAPSEAMRRGPTKAPTRKVVELTSPAPLESIKMPPLERADLVISVDPEELEIFPEEEEATDQQGSPPVKRRRRAGWREKVFQAMTKEEKVKWRAYFSTQGHRGPMPIPDRLKDLVPSARKRIRKLIPTTSPQGPTPSSTQTERPSSAPENEPPQRSLSAQNDMPPQQTSPDLLDQPPEPLVATPEEAMIMEEPVAQGSEQLIQPLHGGNEERQNHSCTICDKDIQGDFATHIRICHKPWYLDAFQACWRCMKDLGSPEALSTHRATHPEESCFSDQDLKHWVTLINGLMLRLSWAAGVENPYQLLDIVNHKALYPSTGVLEISNPLEVFLLSCWEQINQLVKSDKYLMNPPNCPATLIRWEVISKLLSVLAPLETCSILLSAQAMTLDGTSCIPDSVEDTSQPEAADAHAHPDLLLKECRMKTWDQYQERAPAPINITLLVANMVFPTSWEKLDQYVNQPGIICTFGIHPTQLQKSPQAAGEYVMSMVERYQPHIYGIGEIGIDHCKIHSVSEQRSQELLFRELLKVAAYSQLPVVIHCRERQGKFRSAQRPARALCIEHIRNELPRNHPIMVHSFAGTLEDAKVWARYCVNTYFSLGGLLLTQAHDEWTQARERAERAHQEITSCAFTHRGAAYRLVEGIALNRILLESDAPYLAPPGHPYPNHPGNIIEIAEYIAMVKNIPMRAVLHQTLQNTRRFFDTKK